MGPSQSSARSQQRRQLWHWASDHGAPDWLWFLLVRTTWKRCGYCGCRGIGKWKRVARYGGGLAPAHFCTSEHANKVLGMF